MDMNMIALFPIHYFGMKRATSCARCLTVRSSGLLAPTVSTRKIENRRTNQESIFIISSRWRK